MTFRLKPRGGNVVESPSEVIKRYVYNGITGVTTMAQLVTVYPSYRSESWSGQDIVDFHKLKRQGVLLPHTSFTKESIRYSAQCRYHNNLYNAGYPDSVDWYDGNAATMAPSTGILSLESIDAYVESAEPQRFAQEAAAAIYQTGYDALTFLAEFTQIPKLFATTAKKLIRLQLPRNWRELSNDWLSYRYGWRPVIYDIKSLYELYLNYDEKVKRLSERRGLKVSTNETYSEPEVNGSYWRYYYSNSIRYTTSLTGSVCADIAVPQLQFNPLQTAWELIPYSFVIDWFVTTGKALAAAAFVSTAVDYVSSYGYNVTGTRVRDMEFVYLRGSCTSHSSSFHQQCVTQVERRTPCAIPLTPFRTVRLDRYKIADLVSLVAQRFRR